METINIPSQNPQQSSEPRSIDSNRLGGFILIVTVGIVLAYTLLEPLVRPYVYWVVGAIVILLIILVICSIKYPTFRQGLLSGFKSIFHLVWRLVTKKHIDEDNVSATVSNKPRRTPMPRDIERYVIGRARNNCQWEGCHINGNWHIHHIDMDPSNHKTSNLIYLCPNHHTAAHNKGARKWQLHEWAKGKYST